MRRSVEMLRSARDDLRSDHCNTGITNLTVGTGLAMAAGIDVAQRFTTACL
jgi:hypothetical protein